jgi:hypothetical protein
MDVVRVSGAPKSTTDFCLLEKHIISRAPERAKSEQKMFPKNPILQVRGRERNKYPIHAIGILPIRDSYTRQHQTNHEHRLVRECQSDQPVQEPLDRLLAPFPGDPALRAHEKDRKTPGKLTLDGSLHIRTYLPGSEPRKCALRPVRPKEAGSFLFSTCPRAPSRVPARAFRDSDRRECSCPGKP